MGHQWVTRKSLRSLAHPSSRLLILLAAFMTGIWIGTFFSGTTSMQQETEHSDGIIRSKDQVNDKDLVDNYKVIVLIMSAKPHRERRDACRTTWITLSDYRPMRFLFVIGGAGMDSMDMSQLVQENTTNGDLLILSDVPDSYASLTSKLISSLTYISSHFKFKFLLKVDDDSFVRLDLLFDELSETNADRLYWGYFTAGAPVKKAGAWKETNWFMCDKYLPYAVGGGYILSSDLVKYISDNSELLQRYNSEDVSLGTWLSPLNINRKHDTRFDTWYKSRGCSNSFLVTHKMTPGLMMDRFQALETFGHLCKKEKYVVGHLYDWSVLPSQCCNKKESLN
jgi:galactosylxylosylprotein 3-beta-galactosyltransferase